MPSDEQDAEVKAAWAAEILRRAADADADPDDEEDWRTALDDVRLELFSRGSRSDFGASL